MIPKRRELRSYVRTALSYSVKYEVISSEEYYLLKEKPNTLMNQDRKKLKIASPLSDNNGKIDSYFENNVYDNNLVDFLIKMDEKLDSILSLLSINSTRSGALTIGTGNNISASGISIVTSKPAANGQIIHMNINLCKLPPVIIDAYGEIVRAECAHEKEIPTYNLGIKFIDLDEEEKEKIVAYVFSEQRKAIRTGKM